MILGCLQVLHGCSNNPAIDPVHATGLLQDQSLTSNGESRSYHLYLPEDPSSASIVFLLHGNGGSSDQILGLDGTKAPHKRWLDLALQENLILVIPDGSLGPNNQQGWNDCRLDAPTNPNADDVQFISQLHDQVIDTYSAGTPSTFGVGTSNGGIMLMRLADEVPDRFKGLAIVVASRPLNSECVESTMPISVLVMNGTQDPILPYDGGQIGVARGEVFSTRDTIDYWVNRNQTDPIPAEIDLPDLDQSEDSSVQRFSYNNGIDGTRVELYEVVNGGHTEPSILERYGNLFKLIVGEQNGDIETADEILSFFKSL